MRYRIQIYAPDISRDDGWVSIHTAGYHPELLQRLHLLGVVTVRAEKIHARDLRRLDSLLRLRSCLGVNMAGATIILDLLDRIETLQQEIRRLKDE